MDPSKHLEQDPVGISVPSADESFVFPVSFAQGRLWLLSKLIADSSVYNIPMAVRLRGRLNVEALQKSFAALLERHEVLRASFQEEDGSPVQLITPPGATPLSIPVVDLSGLSLEDALRKAHELARESAASPFDLTQGPLLRVSVLKLAEQDHVLTMTIHHIVYDGWSRGVLWRDLSAYYQAFTDGVALSLPELEIQYPDYSVWQRDYLSGETLDKQLQYWKQHLSGAPARLELETDHPRPAMQTFNGTEYGLLIPAPVQEGLKELGRREGVTLFMTLVAAFNVLLARYAGQEDVVVGTPIAGRNRAEVENLIGFFVNTLPLRTDLTGNPAFRELLARVKESSLGAFAHQELPFERLVEELKLSRELSQNPVFQVMFALQNAAQQKLGFPGLSVEPFRSGKRTTAKFDLSLTASDTANGLALAFEYNTDLFEPETIERMAHAFSVLLAGIAENPSQAISDLPLLEPAERQQQLVSFNATEQSFPRELCIHHLFEQQVQRTPDAIAVTDGKTSLSYAELNRRSNQLARFLRKQGVQPETLVGICLGRSVHMLVAVLAVLKAGAAYVPLDPAYPKDRIAFVVQDSQAQVLITQSSLLEILPDTSARRIRIDADWSEIAGEGNTTIESKTGPHSPAYVIYTSGSTGKPKGVEILHRSVVNFLTCMQGEPGFKAEDVLVAVTTLSFDIAGLEMHLPLSVGGKIVIASREEAADGAALTQLLREHKVTVLQATPATWRLLLDSGWPGDSELKALCGGEALPRELAEQLLPRCRELWNMYGPTETTIWSSVYRVQDLNWTSAPIGRPIGNTQMYVLDKNNHMVPLGVPGELHIGGDGLALGYWNRPELTSQKFIPDPFSKNPDARLYKTGDRCRYRADGTIEYLCRLDNQVKLRGFRIELGEIESLLAQHPSIQQAVMSVREDVPGDKRMVGYLVPKPGQQILGMEIRAYLRQTLPDYMVPAALVELDALPLTPNGKVDRKALPAPEFSTAEGDGAFSPPCSPQEEMIAGVWAQILKVARVGIHDNFFELGGHSLLAMQVISRVSQAFGINLPLLALFEAPTVAGLAEKVTTLDGNKSAARTLPLQVISRSGPLQLSFAQQRLWFLDRLDPHNALYNVPTVLRLKGAMNLRALRNALNRIVARHESLRTWFMNRGDAPTQMITPSLELDLVINSVMGAPERAREIEARRLILAETNCPFDLSTGPLIRVMLVKISDNDHVLVINTHHIVSDRWSLGVLRDELITFYAQEEQRTVRESPALPIQYADYAAWQRQLLSGAALTEQLSYWKQKLSGAAASLDLPTDRARPAEQSFRGANHGFDIAKPVAEQLLALGRRENATLFMTLLATFNILLARYSGQEDIVVGSPIAGRSRPELEKLIGFFVNTLVLRTHVDGAASFRELLSQVRETAMGAYAHQDVPFEKLVEELKPDRDLSRNPLFQVMFTAQNVTSQVQTMGSLEIGGMPTASTTSKFDLTVTATERDSGLRLVFEYNTDLFDADRMQRMQQHWQTLLEAIVANPDCAVADLALLEPAERQQILVDWNATGTLAPSTLLHQFIQKQAERTPTATALIDGTSRVSYGELNSRANQLARKLQKLGVGPEVLVAVCTERCADMIVALIAVLKSGGAYVPLDPAYPKDRLAKILEDSHAKVMITQEHLTSILPRHAAELLFIDRDWPAVAHEPTDELDVAVTSQNLAYVLFTSGSTGRPKGVAIEHRSASIFVQWAQTVFTREELSGTLLGTSICFDLSIFEMFVPLSVGGAVIIAQNALALRDLPAANEVRLINTVPSAIAELLHLQAIPNSVLTVNLAGEALPETLAREIYEQTSIRRLYNLYGPTEDTTYSTYAVVPRTGEVTIGRPLANTQAYILDGRRQPVPIGVPGELYLAGDGLARGYYGRDDLTAERFVANPFSAQATARMYRTGDRCRYRSDGTIEYLGRIDNQVKLRGFRIELGEIESLLAQHPSIQQAVVVVREDVPGDKRLIGYVVPKPGQQLSATEARDYLRQGLPDYMVPAAIVELADLPLNPNGKVDRKALPKPDLPEAAPGTVVAPRDVVEEELLSIWKSALQNPAMGVTDNFFDLGGHSLMAAQLVSAMEEAFGRKIRLAALFRGATVEEMARVLREGSESAADPIVMKIQAGGTTPFFAVVAPGMDSIGYAALAQAMGPQQTFYKLQSHRAVKPDAPITLDEMVGIARDYVQAMRSVQPKGPYYLGGMCAGTHIGEQMVMQLEAEGEKVALLAIFDTWVRQNSHVRWKWSVYYYRQRLRGMLRMSLRRQMKMVLGALTKKMQRAATMQGPVETLWSKLYWPGKDFKPPHFQAPVALFKRPKQPFYYIKDEAMGWGERSQGGVHIYRIDFPHQMLREPYVRELAKRLLECISRAAPAPVERLQVWPKVRETVSSTIDV